ncbi:uncharacterized protein LOC123540686 [Mercenaria mercenaria]|uniref:uncharacterized protein LOC123540686 n=1 Tax=Mercenaria mercenaria TaxID=6596 RepID=UPI00234F4A16|nr:uncharacterized protein LOC123540686 [Mercenaria mercenaria]
MEKDTPTPISADEAAFRNPPPTYEEIMGVYQTSIKKEQVVSQEMPTLAYIDIMPKCISKGNIAGNVAPKFESFSKILEGANCLLQDNPNMAIWKCESVTKKLYATKEGTLTYELNTMFRHESTFGFLVYIKGLRLWLTRDPNPKGPPQQIGLRNIVPHKMTVEVPSRGYYRAGKVTIEGVDYKMTNMHGLNMFNTFENLGDTVKRLQENLANDPIPGTILTIETDRIKSYEQFKSDLDPEATCWTENKSKFRRFTQVIRIFYIQGTSAKEEIGYEEFVPELTEAPDSLKPCKFEPFENLMYRLATWVRANPGVRIVNIQQYDAIINNSFSSVEVCSDSTDDFISTFLDQRFTRTLRVFYTKSSAVRGLPANYITSRLFLPARTGPKSFECMTQTMDRIDAWLRVTGLPIYSVETVDLLFNEHQQLGAEYLKSDYNSHSMSGKYWLTAVRVYFSRPYSEPDPALLPPLPLYMTGGGGSSSCNIL